MSYRTLPSLPSPVRTVWVVGGAITALPPAVVRAWFPEVTLPADHQAWRVRDGVIDLRLLSHTLTVRAETAGVQLLRRRVAGLEVRGERVAGMELDGGERLRVAPADVVI